MAPNTPADDTRPFWRRNPLVPMVAGFAAACVAVLVIVVAVATQDNDDDDVSAGATSTTAEEAPTEPPVPETPAEKPKLDPTGELVPGTTPCPAPDGSAPRQLEFTDRFAACIEPDGEYRATFTTSEGTVVVELDAETAPNTVNSFVALARHHYFDDTLLFRTEPSIGIIQGGSPHTQDNSDPGPGYTIDDEGAEFAVDPATGQLLGPFSYEPGQLVMARTPQPDSSSAQFFFTVTDAAAQLDGQGSYIVFGTVTEGLDVLEAILGLHQPDVGGPSREVTVETVTIAEA
jgi:cyclophilin family peptidyl-prolyl cis-trans isomerase